MAANSSNELEVDADGCEGTHKQGPDHVEEPNHKHDLPKSKILRKKRTKNSNMRDGTFAHCRGW